MHKVLVSLAYNKVVIGDYLIPLSITGRDLLKWAIQLLKSKEIISENQRNINVMRIIVKTGQNRVDLEMHETLADLETVEGSLISIL